MRRFRVVVPATFISLLLCPPVFPQTADGTSVSAVASSSTTEECQPEQAQSRSRRKPGIRWQSTINQAGILFSVSQGFRIATQRETRDALKGAYFKDYVVSLRGMGGWRDGDPIITNYVGHPLMGSTYMWILTQNDPEGAPQVFGLSNNPYWRHSLKAVGFSAAYSTFYELGPIGDAGIGNVGLNPETKGAVDLVITPTVGMGWHLTEDMVDKHFIRWVERKTGNLVINSLVRTWLNPSRSVANLLRFRAPWRRDSRGNLFENRLAHLARQQTLPTAASR